MAKTGRATPGTVMQITSLANPLVKEIRAGNIYVNIHSLANPAGELRGQVPADAVPPAGPTTAPPGPPATGSGVSHGETSSTLFAILGGMLLVLAASASALALARRRA